MYRKLGARFFSNSNLLKNPKCRHRECQLFRILTVALHKSQFTDFSLPYTPNLTYGHLTPVAGRQALHTCLNRQSAICPI
jgi:hypothetical protein